MATLDIKISELVDGIATQLHKSSTSSIEQFVKECMYEALTEIHMDWNDEITRTNIQEVLSIMISDLVVQNDINDFRVVCDDTNNKLSDIESSRLNVDVLLTPILTSVTLQISATLQ